jgi:hypothetical protein
MAGRVTAMRSHVTLLESMILNPAQNQRVSMHVPLEMKMVLRTVFSRRFLWRIFQDEKEKTKGWPI